MSEADDYPTSSFDDFSAAPLSPGELKELRRLLARAERRQVSVDDSHPVDASKRQISAGDLAQRVLNSRRVRHEIFGADLFADAAYDILLAMFVSGERNVPVSVTSACLSANVPDTTALRYISSLTGMGYVERMPNPRDGRSMNLKLTPVARDRMRSWLDRFACELNW